MKKSFLFLFFMLMLAFCPFAKADDDNDEWLKHLDVYNGDGLDKPVNAIEYQKIGNDVVNQSIKQLVQMHDLDFERFWVNFNKMDRNTLMLLARGKNPLTQRELPTSTSFSSLKRLTKNGYVIKTEAYEIEDPFFQRWIQQNILSSK